VKELINRYLALKALILGAALSVVMAVPAFAQVDPTTPGEVKTDVLAEATPYIAVLVGIVIALFGLTLLVVLARKASRMAKGGISRG
jgi:TRAP-type C4-dicarboxylate transport system permease small subunit